MVMVFWPLSLLLILLWVVSRKVTQLSWLPGQTSVNKRGQDGSTGDPVTPSLSSEPPLDPHGSQATAYSFFWMNTGALHTERETTGSYARSEPVSTGPLESMFEMIFFSLFTSTGPIVAAAPPESSPERWSTEEGWERQRRHRRSVTSSRPIGFWDMQAGPTCSSGIGVICPVFFFLLVSFLL